MTDETKACPHCGEMIQAQAVFCRFCRTPLGAPAGGPAPAMSESAPPAPPKKSSAPMVILLICVAGLGIFCVIGILAAMLLPAIARAKNRAQTVMCANNLSRLWRMQNIYSSQFGGREKLFSPRTGEEFWLHLSEPGIRLVDPSMAELYQCPLRDSHDRCDYRGPVSDVNELQDGGPVGADKRGNHGMRGGNLLRKSGDVVEIEEGPAWGELDTLLKP